MAMMVPATCAPMAEPMLRMTVFVPVASPVWRSTTASGDCRHFHHASFRRR
jgi:hypothetical protein